MEDYKYDPKMNKGIGAFKTRSFYLFKVQLLILRNNFLT